MNSREPIKELNTAGWKLKRVKGSHRQFAHPDHSHVVTVPHPKKGLGRRLVKAIRKQAGLE